METRLANRRELVLGEKAGWSFAGWVVLSFLVPELIDWLDIYILLGRLLVGDTEVFSCFLLQTEDFGLLVCCSPPPPP